MFIGGIDGIFRKRKEMSDTCKTMRKSFPNLQSIREKKRLLDDVQRKVALLVDAEYGL